MDTTPFDIICSVDYSGLQSLLVVMFYGLLGIFGILSVFLAYELEEEKYHYELEEKQENLAPQVAIHKSILNGSLGFFDRSPSFIISYLMIPASSASTPTHSVEVNTITNKNKVHIPTSWSIPRGLNTILLLFGLIWLNGCEIPKSKEGNWYAIPSPPGQPMAQCYYFNVQGHSNGTGGVVCF